MLPTKFQFIWPSGFRGEDFFKSANQKQELPMVAMFVNGSELNRQSLQRTFQGCFLQCFGSFGQNQAVSEEKILKNRPIRHKYCLWWPCLITDRDGMSNLYRGPSIDIRCFLPSFGSFGQAVSEEKIFQISTNQKQELPVVAMFGNGS